MHCFATITFFVLNNTLSHNPTTVVVKVAMVTKNSQTG